MSLIIPDEFLQTAHISENEEGFLLPITLSASEPEPDIAVVKIDPGAYANHHPT